MSKSQRHHKIPIDVAPPPPSDSDFALSLTRKAVAQICQTRGYKGARGMALEVLTDVAIRYLRSIAKVAAESANRRGCTESNLLDVIFALEDLGSIQGFSGASNLMSRSLYSSGVIKDLMRFVKYTDEIPFAQPLPPGKIFLRANNLKLRGGGEKNARLFCDGGNLRHVPRWLPPLPPVEGGGEAEEGREKERRWGCFDEVVAMEREEENKCRVPVEEKKVKDGEIPLLEKRKKVEFQIGVAVGRVRTGGNMRGGGVCRGGGIGKRVHCSSWSGGGEENQSKRIELAAKNEAEVMIKRRGVRC